jgi:hypothetical protein
MSLGDLLRKGFGYVLLSFGVSQPKPRPNAAPKPEKNPAPPPDSGSPQP